MLTQKDVKRIAKKLQDLEPDRCQRCGGTDFCTDHDITYCIECKKEKE